MNLIKHNQADVLFPVRKVKSEHNKPISKGIAYTLLLSIDQKNWIGKRNYLMISLLWALGLRLSDLTSLKVQDFEPDYDPIKKIGLLQKRGADIF